MMMTMSEPSLSQVVMVQKYARTFIQRTRYRKVRTGVVQMQAVVRGVVQRKQVAQWNRSASTIQNRFRSFQQAKQQRNNFLNVRKAANVLQHRWRLWKKRQKYS